MLCVAGLGLCCTLKEDGLSRLQTLLRYKGVSPPPPPMLVMSYNYGHA